jgi:6-phospho-beta-glucosidase
MKVTIIGGGGLRTPLVIYGLAQAQAHIGTSEVALYDVDAERLAIVARLCRTVLKGFGDPFAIRTCSDLREAASDASFVLNSVRVGGMPARARDERIAIQNGLAGQETTGPGGAAMALRTLPVTLEHAAVVQNVAPRAWFINFTNPAGLITQALSDHTRVRVIGICDTPGELFHKLASCLGELQSEMTFEYSGLNHLGWIRRVTLRNEDITGRILDDLLLLRRLYPAELFDPVLIQTLRLIPTEYLFFYYSQRKAYENQLRAGATRGEELNELNRRLFDLMAREPDEDALSSYRAYLNRRNASYMKLEGQAASALASQEHEADPFETATGYHRIAIELMRGLMSNVPQQIVLNVRNEGSIPDLKDDDVVEVPCFVDSTGVRPLSAGPLPDTIRGLVLAVKGYERTLIRAALNRSITFAQLALLQYPIVGQWEVAGAVLHSLCEHDAEFLGYLN